MKHATKRAEPRRETKVKRDALATKGRAMEMVRSDSNGGGLVEEQTWFAKLPKRTKRGK